MQKGGSGESDGVYKIPKEFYYLFHIYYLCKKVEVVELTGWIKFLGNFIPGVKGAGTLP
jgi:hypothetical protein